jgi:two-component system sensor histidine kinase HydH
MEKILADALGQDFTKLAEQAKRLLLSRLLARLAHEIRNPLSSLDIHVQLLAEDLTEAPASIREKTAGRFEIIQGELHRLENIVKHFLSLAAPSALNLERTAPATILRHVCELLRPEAATRDVELALRLPEDLPVFSADPAQITQALVNIIINAIQAVDRQGRVEVSAFTNQGRDTLCMAVSDTGPGIPEGKNSAIFEPFFTTKPDGSGLGLWIVQQIVSAHGGQIDASNAPEGGARFVVQFPLGQTQNQDG